MATLQNSNEADDSEERLRLSLSRMGPSAKAGPSRPYQLTQPVRRRFVKDGEVPTEYSGRGHEPSAHPEADEALSALRTELAVGQAAREEAELALATAKATNRTLQTRIGHMELELEELRARAVRAAEMAAEAAEVTRLQEVKPARSVRVARPVAAREDDEDEEAGEPGDPQPVKWWLKK